MTTTPPLKTTSVSQPPTPLHGGRYEYHRQHLARKRTRSTTRRGKEPPSPSTGDHSGETRSSRQKPVVDYRLPASTLSPPPSAHTTPRGKYTQSRCSSEKGIMEVTVSNQRKPRAHSDMVETAHVLHSDSMLPTPAKTPAKKRISTTAMQGAARVLFPVRADLAEDAMPKPRRNRTTRHVGFALYGQVEEEDTSLESNIQIHTDSRDRVPDAVPNEDNPFLESSPPTVAPHWTSKGRIGRKRKARGAIEEVPEIRKAFDREDGMVYVFRGKKMFRRFPDEGPDDGDDGTIGGSDDEESTTRPLTRSAIKPRLLFPTPRQRTERSASALEDEEAATDLEDQSSGGQGEEHLNTPVGSRFPPVLSPNTSHATRSSTKQARQPRRQSPSTMSEGLCKEPAEFELRAKKVSPFDTWARRKAVGDVGKGKKRESEAMDGNPGIQQSKRVKTHGVD